MPKKLTEDTQPVSSDAKLLSSLFPSQVLLISQNKKPRSSGRDDEVIKPSAQAELCSMLIYSLCV